MFERRQTKQIFVGNTGIGSEHPVSVQSMTNTDTRDVAATVSQINRLQNAGCEVVRLAVPDKIAAEALKAIKKDITIPLIADIHFDYKLALASIECGLEGLRINPGNIGSQQKVKELVASAKANNVAIRIGVNSGSLEREYVHLPVVDAMVESALKHVRLLEAEAFDQIKISLKSSSVPVTIKAYRKLAKLVDYPFHVGVTEAGTIKSGTIKSTAGIATLLAEGIGDTIRVSLTDDPVEEVIVAYEILKALEIRAKGLNLISCPTCGRTEIDIIKLARQVEESLKSIEKPITVAVMGCVVNGPGEAKHADIGIAGGKEKAVLFKKGEVYKTVPQEEILEVLLSEISAMV